MNGLSRVAGVGPNIKLGGREFKTRGRTLGYFAALEAELLRLRGNPLDLIVEAAKSLRGPDGAIDKVQVVVLDQIAGVVAEKFRNWRFSTYQDQNEFLLTSRGDAFRVWWAISGDARDVSIDQVQHWLMELRESLFAIADKDEREKARTERLDAIYSAIELASGDDVLGNSTGRQPETTPTPAPSSGS